MCHNPLGVLVCSVPLGQSDSGMNGAFEKVLLAVLKHGLHRVLTAGSALQLVNNIMRSWV